MPTPLFGSRRGPKSLETLFLDFLYLFLFLFLFSDFRNHNALSIRYRSQLQTSHRHRAGFRGGQGAPAPGPHQQRAPHQTLHVIFCVDCTEYLCITFYPEILYRISIHQLTGQSWSKWLLWLPKTLRNTVKRIMLAWFQISHSDGFKGSSVHTSPHFLRPLAGVSIPIYRWRQMRHGQFFFGGGE